MLISIQALAATELKAQRRQAKESTSRKERKGIGDPNNVTPYQHGNKKLPT